LDQIPKSKHALYPHHESSIKCINANIHLHKGKVTGRKVEVTTLDGGEIIADTAIITNAMSGTIRAKTIEISVLGSHVIMEASQSIRIKRVKGEENKFIFESSVNNSFNENKKDNEKYLAKLKNKLSTSIKAFKEITAMIKKNLAPCEKIKAIIIKKKNENSQIPADIIKKFKICKLMKINYKKSKEKVNYEKSQYLKQEQISSTNILNIRDAKIILDEALHGYNYIKYKLDKPKVDIELRTEDSMRKKVFKLIEDEDGVSKIINI